MKKEASVILAKCAQDKLYGIRIEKRDNDWVRTWAFKLKEETAEKEGCFCKKIGKDAYEILGIEDKHIAFSCASAYYGTTTWKLNNIGLYQPHNALLAMEVMRGLFGENGHPHLWKEALEAVRWRGRMEEVLPGVYVDGAHNISAVKAFAETVEKAGFADAVLFSAVRDLSLIHISEPTRP